MFPFKNENVFITEDFKNSIVLDMKKHEENASLLLLTFNSCLF